MKRKRYSEEQIIAILKEAEAGATVADVMQGKPVKTAAKVGEAGCYCNAGSKIIADMPSVCPHACHSGKSSKG